MQNGTPKTTDNLMEKLFLIDAYALIFKFYYAFIHRPMRNREGLNTSAIYGFTKFLNDIVAKEKPKYLGVAFDPRGGNFRHQLYSLYKANRGETPEDIILSVPYIKQILNAMRIPILEIPGYEADDVIGTLAKKAAEKGDIQVFMVTPDKDYGQLVDEHICMYKPRKSGDSVEILDAAAISKQYGIDHPRQVIDILALWGDTSDNVPGVPGIGEKSAAKLVGQYGSIDGIFENLDKLKDKQRESILEHKDRLLLARELVTICLNVPIAFDLNDFNVDIPDFCPLRDIYRELNFATLLHDLEVSCGEKLPPRQPEMIAGMQGSLFEDELFDQAAASHSREQGAKQTPATETPSLFDDLSTPDYHTIADTEHQYVSIESLYELDMLIELIRMKGEFCFDTETTGLNPIEDELVGISFAIEKGKAYYLHVADHRHFLPRLKEVFESENIAKIGQNIKFDILALKSNGIEVRGTLYDTMILQYLINSDDNNSMDYMARKYLGYSPVPIEELIGKGSSQITMDKVDKTIVKEYAAEDADITLQLKEYLWDNLRRLGLDTLYREVEEPLIRVLAEMEYKGVMIDNEMLGQYAAELQKELDTIETQIRELSEDKQLNINSPKQLGELLFEKLKIVEKPKKTKTKQYKTDEDYLLSLKDKHEIVEMILEYRGIKKLLSTYVLALPKLISPKTGRVHTSYNQALTRTGRLSSSNPNLQNIPIRDKRGEMIRKAFVAQGEDKVILSADYSQVELRIMAHLSEDENMIEAFFSGEDIHTATAAKIYGKPAAEVTKEERANAKSANFGIIYGISAFGLSQNLGIPTKEAKYLIESYFALYPKVKQYMETSIERVRESGYSETLYGRKRFLPDINSSSAVTRGFAERNAINAPIQGSAADIIKIAMSKLHRALETGGYKSKIILQVHDELVLEVEKSELQEILPLVSQNMEQAAALKVPLLAEARYGKNWFDAH